MAEEDTHSSLLRGVSALIGLAEFGRPVSFSVLAEALHLPPSSAHRILSVLKRANYVKQDPATGSYSPGPAFLRAATTFCVSTAFPTALREALGEVVETTGESAYYAVYLKEMQRLRFAMNIYSDHAVQYVTRQDKDYSLLWGASGRSIAAFLPEKTLRILYAREEAGGEGNIRLPPWEVFEAELRQVRAQGVCTTTNQRFEGSHSTASPILGPGQQVIGCVGIAMPSLRLDRDKVDELSRLIRATAQHLSMFAQCSIPDEPDRRTAG